MQEVLDDLLTVLYLQVSMMGKHEGCGEVNHINKKEVLALIEDIQEALKGE